MFRLRYHAPGTSPGTLAVADDAAQGPAEITLIQYDQNSFRESPVMGFDDLVAAIDPNKVNWINIDGLGDIDLLQKIASHFSIHPLALEDVLNTTQRPKVDFFDDHYFIVSEMIYASDEKSVSIEQVSMFLGDHYLLTIQEARGYDVFNAVRQRLRSGRGNARSRCSDYLAYALIDATVDQFFPLLESVGDSIEEIEDILLEKPTRETLRRLYECKRILLMLRRAAWPQREIINTLLRDEAGLVRQSTRVFLRDCYDHSVQIIDILESFRDLAAGLMDVYLSSMGFRTNEIMRTLTVVSVLFIPLTFLAGVYGMNFDTNLPLNMPELRWPFGYVYFWSVCLLIVISMLFFFHKKKWL
ncbi:MAG: magnesium/cobalt transporter CorA [Terrimicrobiaceae bacterium]